MHHNVLKDIDNVVSSIQSLKFNSAYQFDDMLYIAYAFENSYEQLKQQQIRHLDKTQTLAHDIKTPLTIIKAIIEGIIKNKIELDKATMDSLNEETHRVTHLIESIIEDSEPYSLERVNVSTIMTNTIDRFKPLYIEKSVHFKTQIENDVQMVANPVDIERMVDHLLQNSLKYTPKNKQVFVELRSKPLTIVVSDQGVGFDVDELEIAIKKASPTGTGIGLRIVDSIVQRYGGELKIESTLNQGTSVWITFDS